MRPANSRDLIVPFGAFLLVACADSTGTVLDPSTPVSDVQVGQTLAQSLAAFGFDDRNGVEDHCR